MLRIHQNTSPAGAKRYYTAAYYAKGQELEMVGDWGGRGAQRLGLVGRVDQRSFEQLCDNLHPMTRMQLTPRQRSDRTVGYDFNFNACKSISLLYARYQDPEILDVFRSSVRDTMEELEAEMKTRVRKGGQDSERATANLTWAEYVHFTARPVDGVCDPSLHGHVFVFNQTFDPVENRWKAGYFRDLKRDAPYWEAAFQSRLAGRLKALGYEIERKGKDWDVAGLSPELLKKFSRRTTVIESKAKELGAETPGQKAAVGALTRENKQEEMTWKELKENWESRLTEPERGQLDAVRGRLNSPEGRPAVTADQALGQALSHLLERNSVVPEKRLLASALRFGLGDVSVDEMKMTLARSGVLTAEQDGQTMVTTREVLREEQAMLAFARGGRGACRPLAPGHPVSREWLNAGQRAAVRHVLESPDRVMLIRGVAGVGKTTLTKEAVEAIEATGRNVVMVAPTAQASRGVLRSEGFEKAETIEKLLTDESLQRSLAQGVLIVDEAGLTGVRDMARLFKLADEKQARVVVMGDTRQHRAVPRGAAMRLLEREAGIVAVEVKDIKRQSGAYRDAVAALADGRAADGFDRLDALGWIHESRDGTQHERLAVDYGDAVARGEKVLVISPTHREGEKVTAAIRHELKQRGMINGNERGTLRLSSLNLTEAERADAANYRGAEESLVVQFLQNSPGFDRGTRAEVVGVEGDAVKVRTTAGREATLPLKQAKRFQVYRSGVVPLAAGDKIRITQNGYSSDKHRLNNGSVYSVAGFTPAGDIRLDNGWQLPADFGHLAPGVVVTSHASQGRTVDRVLIAQASDSFAATGQEQLYVSASRGRKQAVIYTDDKQALRDAVTRQDVAISATELLKPPASRRKKMKTHVSHLQRLATRSHAYASRVLDSVRGRMAERTLIRE